MDGYTCVENITRDPGFIATVIMSLEANTYSWGFNLK